MKIRYIILALTLAFSQFLHAGGTTGPCTPPSAEIQITPDQKCSGKNTVAIGKDVSLEATEMKDKDCYCGAAVHDTINTTAGGGVEWTVGGGQYGGSFPNGADSSPATWTASSDPHTSLAVRLKLNDDGPNGSVPNAQEDGPLQELNSKNLDVVIPDKDVSALDQTHACGSGTFGVDHRYKGTLSRNNCTVDFAGLEVTETGCTETQNTCGYPPGSTGNGCGNGTVWGTVDSQNDYKHDRLSNCSTLNPSNCAVSRTLYWAIRANGGGNHSLPNHIAWFHIPAAGANSTTTSRTP